MQRLEPAAELGDRLDIGHAERSLDQRLEPDAGGKAFRLLDLVDHRLDHVKVGRQAHLGHEERVNAVARLLHHIHHVAVHVMRIKPVDPDRDRLAPRRPVDVVERLDHVATRDFLFGRGDRVFEVEEDIVGRPVRGLVDHRRVRPRDGEFGPLQACLAQGVKRMAHRLTRPPCGR